MILLPIDWARRCVLAVFLASSPALFAYAYSKAEASSPQRFTIFWVAMFVMIIPATWRILKHETTQSESNGHLFYIGVVSMIPKYLRNPSGVIYFDEIAHWSQTSRLAATGKMFQPNSQVEIIENFPGLHTVTGSIQHFAGITTTNAAWLVLIACHVLTIGGVAVLGRVSTDSLRAGSLAGLMYAVGPATWFFNAMFSYQSIAVVFFIWFLVAITYCVRSSFFAGGRPAWMFVAILFTVSLTMTHHLTTYMTIVLLACTMSGFLWRALFRKDGWRHVRELTMVLVLLVFLATTWAMWQAPRIVSYLKPFVESAFGELANTVSGAAKKEDPSAAPQKTHEFFKGSVLPLYEQILSFTIPIAACSLAGFAVIGRKRLKNLSTMLLGTAVASGVYFASFPMMLTPSGNEGARRSWAYFSVPAAVMMGLGASIATRKAGKIRAFLAPIFVVVCVVAISIGNIAADVNESSRLPGPYTYGSDTRGQTREAEETANWLRNTFGIYQRVIADRYLGVHMVRDGSAIASAGSADLPVWDYFISATPISDDLYVKTHDRDFQFLVVDKRSSKSVPEIGFYVDRNEPGGGERTVPAPQAAIDRFEYYGWLAKVYSSNSIDIYRILGYNLDPTQTGIDNSSPEIPKEVTK